VSAITGTANWLFMAFAVATAVLRQALRPMTWRRPVRLEFWRFMEIVCLRNLVAVCVAASLIGLTLVSQGLYWLDQFGQADAVGQVIVFAMVREIGPIVVGLLALGGGGIVLLGEISTLRGSGQLAALDRLGIDPFLLLVVPRVIAIIIAVFAHSIIFIVVALFTGYVVAHATGAIATAPGQFFASMLTAIGATGYIILPAKALGIGLTIGSVCALTALDPRAGASGQAILTSTRSLPCCWSAR
jgi:phospholipid/cholesterol/gamma-HCH transport system permease protein